MGAQARRWRPPEYTEEEWPYRQVLSYVHTELVAHQGAPAEAEAWVAWPKAELREQLGPDGAPSARNGGP